MKFLKSRFVAAASVLAVLAIATAPVAAQNQSLPEAIYENDMAVLQASLEAVAEPAHTALVLPVASPKDRAVAEGFSPVSKKSETSIAIEGYSPVGFFAEHMSVKGSPNFTGHYNGAMKYFASSVNHNQFTTNTSRFEPAYGGYCTNTIAKGVLTTGVLATYEPINWTLHGNRLYLASSPSTQKSLRENLAHSVEIADRYWAEADSYLDQYGLGFSPELAHSSKRVC